MFGEELTGLGTLLDQIVLDIPLTTNVRINVKHARFNSLPDDKLICFADDNFEIDENGRKFSKRVENTVGKGEIARYEQFLLFPQCFQKTCTADT